MQAVNFSAIIIQLSIVTKFYKAFVEDTVVATSGWQHFLHKNCNVKCHVIVLNFLKIKYENIAFNTVSGCGQL